MSKTYVFPIAVALMIVPIYLDRADATPLVPHDLAAVAPSSNAEPVYYRAAVRGPRGGVAVRGPRGAVAVGPRGGVAVRGGAYRVGGRYYGGVGTVPDADGMAVAGGLTVSAAAGRRLPSAMFGHVGESGTMRGEV